MANAVEFEVIDVRESNSVDPAQTPKARREASGQMGQIGILARVSRRTVATRHAIVAMPQIGDATVVARGKARKHGRSVECDDSLDRSLALQMHPPVQAGGCFWRYSDNLVVGGFSTVSREKWAFQHSLPESR